MRRAYWRIAAFALIGLSVLDGGAVTKVEVVVSPSLIYLRPGQDTVFQALVVGAKAQKVIWSASQGTITSSGVYTAGASGGSATITARWAHDRKQFGNATATVVVSPVSYSLARTDQFPQALPSPMPSWGGLYGIGTKWCDPAFSGLCSIRVTDGATSGSSQSTLQTADSGEQPLFTVDSKHLVVKTPGGREYVVGFDPTTEAVSRTPIAFRYDSVVASRHDPQLLYGADGTKLRFIRMKADWSGVESDQTLFDFATCLPNGFQLTWSGTFGTVLEDNSFRIAFSNTGGQGSGIYLAAYQTETIGTIGSGCYVLNTREGTVTGPNGFIGTVDDGVNPLLDRFTEHEGGGGQNPLYAMVGYSAKQPDGSSGCLAGSCPTNSPYVWEVGTTHLRPCSIECDGHAAKGYAGWETGKQYRLHRYSDPTQPLIPMAQFPPGFPDQHGSWVNTDEQDTPPAFLVSSAVNQAIPYPTWGYDEILAVASDGSQKTWRFGQTLNSGTSEYFIVQYAIGVVSQDGRWLAYASDSCGAGCPSPAPLGYDKKGKPRGDVFIRELR